MTKTVNPNWVQGHWAFGADDNDIDNHTLYTEDTSTTFNADTSFVFRINWGDSAGQNDGAGNPVTSVAPTLEYNINSGSWVTVSASSAIQYYNSSNDTDGDTSSTLRISTAPTGVATGVESEWDENNTLPTVGPQDEYYEIAFVLYADSAQLSNNDTIYYQLVLDVDTFDARDTPLPSMTVSVAAGDSTSSIPVETISVTAQVPSAIVDDISSIPVETMTLSALAPTATHGASYGFDLAMLEHNLYLPGEKPMGPMKIDWDHPLAQGLEAAFLFNPYNATAGIVLSTKTLDMTGHGYDITWVVVPKFDVYVNTAGIQESSQFACIGNGSSVYGYIDAGNIPTAGADIHCVAYSGVINAGGDAFASIYGPTGGTSDFQIWPGSSGWQVQAHDAAGGDTVCYTTGVLDKRVRGLYWCDNANSEQKLWGYKDGLHSNSATTFTTTTWPTASRKFLIMADADSLGTDGDGTMGNWLDGCLDYLYFWNRKLSDAEAMSLNEDPYQIFIPI